MDTMTLTQEPTLKSIVKELVSTNAKRIDGEFRKKFSELIQLTKKEGLDFMYKYNYIGSPAKIHFYKEGFEKGIQPEPNILFLSETEYALRIGVAEIPNNDINTFYCYLYQYFFGEIE